MLREDEKSSIAARLHSETGDALDARTPSEVAREEGRAALGEVPKAEHPSNVDKVDKMAMKRAGAWALRGHSCDHRFC
jgi:hypothetical protein